MCIRDSINAPDPYSINTKLATQTSISSFDIGCSAFNPNLNPFFSSEDLFASEVEPLALNSIHSFNSLFSLANSETIGWARDKPIKETPIMVSGRVVKTFILCLFDKLKEKCLKKTAELKIDAEFFQSNIEGELVQKIQDIRNNHNGLIINAGGYTHTSVAIHDALKIIKIPIIELHISNIYNREEFRHKSLISKVAKGVICGFGDSGYVMALKAMNEILNNENR